MSKFKKAFEDKMKELQDIKEFYEVQDVYEDDEYDDADPGFDDLNDEEDDDFSNVDGEGGFMVPLDDEGEDEFDDEEFHDDDEIQDEEPEEEEVKETFKGPSEEEWADHDKKMKEKGFDPKTGETS